MADIEPATDDYPPMPDDEIARYEAAEARGESLMRTVTTADVMRLVARIRQEQARYQEAVKFAADIDTEASALARRADAAEADVARITEIWNRTTQVANDLSADVARLKGEGEMIFHDAEWVQTPEGQAEQRRLDEKLPGNILLGKLECPCGRALLATQKAKTE